MISAVDVQSRLTGPAHVAGEDSPLGLQRLGDRDELVGGGVHAGSVDQARGQTEGSLVHALLHERLHLAHLLVARWPGCEAHDRDPDGPVGSERDDVEADAPLRDSVSRYSPMLAQSKQKPSDWKKAV